jgi:hypothetical protein
MEAIIVSQLKYYKKYTIKKYYKKYTIKKYKKKYTKKKIP